MSRSVSAPKRRTVSSKKVLVLHGPNLQLLGERNPSVYGRVKLATINERLKTQAKQLKLSLTIEQFNHEGELVEAIGQAQKEFDGILINPAAYTHTSVAIRDALEAVRLPAVEVHLSNIYRREAFRHTSLISPVVDGQVSGFGPESYSLGLTALASLLTGKSRKR